jgi:hypothetical protein
MRAALGIDERRAQRVGELGAAAVREREPQQQPAVRGREPLGFAQDRERSRRQIREASHADEAHVVVHQRRSLVDKEALEQPHQEVDLRARTLPVFDRERVERQALDAHARALGRDLAHRADAFAVAEHAPQAARLRPTAVAVHDDGDVLGECAAELGAFDAQLRRAAVALSAHAE